MSIREQVKELRELTADMEKYVGLRPKPHILREAADTIESLSAKLQATNMESDLIKRESVLKLIEDIKCNPDLPKNYGTLLDIMREVRGIPAVYDSENIIKVNMERSEEDCGGWIYCGDGENLPAEPFACIVTVIDTEPMTQEDFESILPYHVGYDGKQWNDIEGNRIPFEVIAWTYAPKEPYHEP